MSRFAPLLVVLVASVVFAQGAAKASPPAPSGGGTSTDVFVGVVAALNDEVAKKQADALGVWASQALKEPVQSRVFADQEALALAVSKGEVDLALMGPLAYLRIDPKAKTQLVFRMVRNGKATYRAVIFGPASTKLTDITALKRAKNLKVAWVETSSATGYVIPKAQLLLSGINPVQIFETQDFLGSHDAVCTAVAAEKYDVGATFSDPDGKAVKVSGCVGALGKKADALKVVTASDEVPNDVLVASPRFSAGKVQALQAAGKASANSEAAKKSLKAALLADGVADVKDEDFAPVRRALDAFSK